MVLIIYRNKQGNITRMDPKRVVYAGSRNMAVDYGPHGDAPGFTLLYEGVLDITLFVDVRL